MSIFTTNLTRDDFSEKFLNDFAQTLRRGVAPRMSKWRIFLLWCGLAQRTPMPYDITKTDLEKFFKDGARAALEKYNLPESELDHIEYEGCVLGEKEKSELDFTKLVPRSAYVNALHELGYNFGGNHFLEIHTVEDIIDAERAARWGLKEDQLVFFYHGGGGHATYHFGRYFGRRLKNTTRERAILFFLKFLFHFGSHRSLKHFAPRWHAYFSKKLFPEIPVDSEEGQRLFQSIKLSLNYGYAFRTALLRRIKDALPKGDASFLWDAAHNSILEETIDGQQYIVHRQDAVRGFEGNPIMIAGGNNTLSYIGSGGPKLKDSFYSVTPSAGKTIEATLEPDDEEHITLISKRKLPRPIRKQHISSKGLFAVTSVLESKHIIEPVAYIRPLASIKGH